MLIGVITWYFLFFTDSFLEKSGLSNEPEFVEDIKNVTVASGREAIISCVVSNLGRYKVSLDTTAQGNSPCIHSRSSYSTTTATKKFLITKQLFLKVKCVVVVV